MKCPKCLQEVHPSAVRCSCGNDLKKASRPFSALRQKYKEELKSEWLLLLWVLGGAIDFLVNVYPEAKPGLNTIRLIIICPLLTVSIGRIIYGYLYRKNAVRNWPTAIGRIIISLVDIGKVKRSVLLGFVPKVVYEYSVSGITYRNNKISRSVFAFRARDNLQKYSDRFKKGKEVAVLYNPRKPWESFLEKD